MLSKIKPSYRCFLEWQDLSLVLLKVYRIKFLLWTYFGKNHLNRSFYWKAQLLTFCKSQFSSSCEVSLSRTLGKKRCVIGKNWQVNRMLTGKSFIYIKNLSGQSRDPWGTPNFMSSHAEVWPFRTTLW